MNWGDCFTIVLGAILLAGAIFNTVANARAAILLCFDDLGPDAFTMALGVAASSFVGLSGMLTYLIFRDLLHLDAGQIMVAGLVNFVAFMFHMAIEEQLG